MKRSMIVAAVGLSLGFATAGRADAQIVYGYNVPGNGGLYSNRTVVAPGGFQTHNSFFSPFTGVMQNQVYGANVFGQAYGRSYGYNPWNGLNYNSGFYQPNYYVLPFGGFNYGYVRRWGW